MKNYDPSTLTRAILCLAAIFFIRQAAAQKYYPGGLGNSNLVIWLNAGKSSSVSMNGAGKVSQWSDLSGNGYNFTSSSNNRPTYVATAGPNSRPALTFTPSSNPQYLSLASLPSSVVFTGGTSVFVQVGFNASQSSWGWERVFDLGNGAASNNITFGRYGSTANFYYEGFKGGTGDQTYTTTNAVVNGTSNIYEAVQQGGSAGTLTAVGHYLAGASQANNGAAGSSSAWVHTAINRTSNYIGLSNWSADDYFSGTMSEILLYNTAFNTTQRVIMENYLSAEWGRSVSISKYTPPTSTTYITNLVGVGYTSATDNFTTNPSGSTDGLGFSSGTGASDLLNTAGYLMAAHNGQSNTVITNATIPGIYSASSITRWNRSWDVQRTGGNSSGKVTVNFNFSDYNTALGAPLATYSYALLYNATDGTFASGTNKVVTTVSTPAISGNIVSLLVNAANLANGYYTIIYSASPLPVTLTGFTAVRQENNALVKWSVDHEVNIDRYEIQRGAGTEDLVTVGSVAAVNSGVLTGKYSFTDNAPGAGRNYYRLKIVDREGASTYSPVVPLDFPMSSSTVIRLYPNPAVDRVHVVSSGQVVVSVLVINTRGQVVRTVKPATSGTLDIPVSDLSKGLYFVEVDTDRGRYVQKVIKN
ncbi:MAG: T9SS type A sorting domain-containing protein [Chitinophagaceae bacterium]|nr:T9SS type A sorting domain-containing protein [Chitinophagaceae bacterium]